jgi:hypothetical protein
MKVRFDESQSHLTIWNQSVEIITKQIQWISFWPSPPLPPSYFRPLSRQSSLPRPAVLNAAPSVPSPVAGPCISPLSKQCRCYGEGRPVMYHALLQRLGKQQQRNLHISTDQLRSATNNSVFIIQSLEEAQKSECFTLTKDNKKISTTTCFTSKCSGKFCDNQAEIRGQIIKV